MSLLVVLGLYLASVAEAASGDNVHRRDVGCSVCHTEDENALAARGAAAAALLIPNLEAVCIVMTSSRRSPVR